MKIIILLLSLGLVASCGTDSRYADTLASGDEHQTEQGGHTSKIVAGVAVAVVATCVVVGLKKRCVPFVKRITRTDDFSKEIRQGIKDGEITKKEAKEFRKAMKGFDQLLPEEKALALYQERIELLTDQEKVTEFIRKGMSEGKSVADIEELTVYQKEINQKALQQLLDEGKITPEDAKKIKEITPGLN